MGGKGTAKLVLPLTTDFSVPIFSAIQFLFLCISWSLW